MKNNFFCILFFENGKLGYAYFEEMSFEEVKIKCQTQSTVPLFCISFKKPQKTSFSKKDLETLFFYLSNFLESGLSLEESLKNLDVKLFSVKAQKVIPSLLSHVEAGKSFIDFFKTIGVDPIVVASLKSGEASGSWIESFQDLASFVRTSHESEQRLRNLMLYPKFVILSLFSFLFFVFPYLIINFSHLTPPSEQGILFKIGSFIYENQSILIICFIAIFLISLLFKKISYKLHHFFLIKIFKLNSDLEWFFYLLYFLSKGKNSLMDSIKLIEENYQIYGVSITQIRKNIEKGMPLKEAFQGGGNMPHFIISMISLSHQTGKSTEVFRKIYEILNKIHRQKKEAIETILPSITIGIIGGVFIIITLAIFLPIYNYSVNLTVG